MIIEGFTYQEGSAAQLSAALHIDNNLFTLYIENKSVLTGDKNELNISNRLGNIQRKITLPNGDIFNSLENDAIDQIEQGNNTAPKFLHILESKLHWAILAIFFTIAFTFSFFKWGVPVIGHHVAHLLPHKTNEIIGSQAMKLLDTFYLTPSKLSQEKQDKITKEFTKKLLPLANTSKDIQYKLHFREWEMDDLEIPNALALPSGDIIITDKLVEISGHQNEINAVLLHEIGHIEERHTLEMITETTIVGTVIMLAFGDSNMLADMGVGVGSILVSSNYSRSHELEADKFAFIKMLKSDMNPELLGTILNRMGDAMEKPSSKEKPKYKNKEEKVMDYFSSHPNTKKRTALAQSYSACFKQSLTAKQCLNKIKQRQLKNTNLSD